MTHIWQSARARLSTCSNKEQSPYQRGENDGKLKFSHILSRIHLDKIHPSRRIDWVSLLKESSKTSQLRWWLREERSLCSRMTDSGYICDINSCRSILKQKVTFLKTRSDKLRRDNVKRSSDIYVKIKFSFVCQGIQSCPSKNPLAEGKYCLDRVVVRRGSDVEDGSDTELSHPVIDHICCMDRGFVHKQKEWFVSHDTRKLCQIFSERFLCWNFLDNVKKDYSSVRTHCGCDWPVASVDLMLVYLNVDSSGTPSTSHMRCFCERYLVEKQDRLSQKFCLWQKF